mmetsp:Transcript_3684/g.8027  ORF Transcript_3684/g.8027 Transcript_3684/m.8027 type:complete len:317 (+) Transcript_3684:28-978(+)|eukprot:CAMPEP_0201223842 /NCGR_PEP_ID=MMETSP0851-20130426/193312_1 /ASSEMBLY_ACC=CAM_ASM_000631 /TAXON_ID=183588 /ORGANISM="Pseudo-nitzschia fraudulenta, Strain WWA7" /LENGTH=316 /DNA_ID=CAMNT_0047513601 /DNA_START=62 /DNA_END=1012 /DNA_ORIENTATION=-
MKHLETFLEIINDLGPLAGCSKDDKDACESLLEKFGEVETDEIANVSYAYWIVSSKAKEKLPVDAQRNSALKEIRRHYVGEGRNCMNTLAAIRKALEYRRDYRVNILRSCFDDTQDHEAEVAELVKRYRLSVLGDLKIQPMVVRGIDDNDRVIAYKPPRTSSSKAADPDEAFILTQIYTAEKLAATNEFASKGKEEKVTVVFNFGGYSREYSPSTSCIITMAKVLQRCYPERLGVLIVVDPPLWIRGVYNMTWPFLSTATAKKIRIASGQNAVDNELEKIVSGNSELIGMLANGTISSVDLTDYTQQPFYSEFEQR